MELTDTHGSQNQEGDPRGVLWGANDDAGPFSIGQNVWPGLAKLAEECGEVVQIIAKLIATGGRTDHWSGLDLRVELENEMADVRAALAFVAAHNPDLDVDRINGRVARKTALFVQWHGGNQVSSE